MGMQRTNHDQDVCYRYDDMKTSFDAQLSAFETGGKLSQFDWPFETELIRSFQKRVKSCQELFLVATVI